jgi:hypothetical protein
MNADCWHGLNVKFTKSAWPEIGKSCNFIQSSVYHTSLHNVLAGFQSAKIGRTPQEFTGPLQPRGPA